MQVEPEKLPISITKVLKVSENRLFLSSVSPWEISIKYAKGKLPEGEKLIANYEKSLKKLNIRELFITGKHAIKAGQLEMLHQDPFDRLIIAQAMLEQITVVTLDKIFKSYGISVIN